MTLFICRVSFCSVPTSHGFVLPLHSINLCKYVWCCVWCSTGARGILGEGHNNDDVMTSCQTLSFLILELPSLSAPLSLRHNIRRLAELRDGVSLLAPPSAAMTHELDMALQCVAAICSHGCKQWCRMTLRC